jgi:uncharacterized ParB-like nuclease family protein
MLKKLFFISLLTSSLVACKTAIQPMYVTTGEVASLTTGMTKQEAKASLGNLNPHDILMAQEGGCEVHQYKYKTPEKIVSPSRADKNDGLTEGRRQYVDESDVFLVYKGGKLASVVTNAGKADAIKLMQDIAGAQALCNESGLKGCTDPASLSYNPNAVIDDGSCTYCECGSVPNPNYNPNRPVSDCNQKCVKIEGETPTNEPACTNCDLIDKLSKTNANVNINVSLPSDNGASVKGTTSTAKSSNTKGSDAKKTAKPGEKKGNPISNLKKKLVKTN